MSLACAAQTQDALNGVWEIEELTTEAGENPGIFTDLPPSLYIFTDGYYSIMSILGDGSRPDFQPGDDVSDEDTIAATTRSSVTLDPMKSPDQRLDLISW